jgi:hypothetical protein
MFRNKTGEALKNLIEARGEDGACQVLRESFKSKRLRPEDMSLKEIWEACEPGRMVNEAITSSMFPKLTGELINAKVISAYEAIPDIGGMLTTTVASRMQIERFAGLTSAEAPEEVAEGGEYKDSTRSEKYVDIPNKKYGRRIDITEETIFFDKTGQILMRANDIGEEAAQYKQEIILAGVQDLNGDVWRPSGTPTAFYSATNGNLITANPFCESGLEEVMKKAQLMKNDSLGAGTGGYVFIDLNNVYVLVPILLQKEAWELANSVKTPESAENAENYFKGRFTPISSPFVSAQSDSTWYWGNFAKDFVWLEVWPLQTITKPPGGDDEFKRDVKSSTKVRFYGGVGALDVKHCFKNTA